MTKKHSEKKNSKHTGESFNIMSTLKEETRHGMIAVAVIAVAIFFVLAAFDRAGIVGRALYGWFESLLGVGYFILPLSLILVGALFFKNTRPRLAATTAIGVTLFFLSGLGLLNLVAYRIAGSNLGGELGKVVSQPLSSLFDFWISLVFLTAIFIVSLSIMFDTKPTFAFLSSLRQMTVKGGSDNEAEEYKDVEEASSLPTQGVGEISDSNTGTEEAADGGEGKRAGGNIGKIKDALGIGNGDMSDLSAQYMKHIEYTPPPLALLSTDRGRPGVGDVKANANIIKRTLQNFGITVEMDEVSIGPSVTRYALKPAEGVKLSRIVGLQNDLALALAAHPLRIEAPIPGKSLVGIEIPNSTKTTVGLGTLLASEEYQKSNKPLLFSLGRGISGKSHFADLTRMPHILIAGATGSGKSVSIHTIINSLLFRNHPENLRFIMIDPKRVELTLYNNIPHLLTPVITDPKKAILALKWAAKEMDRRYDILEAEAVRDVASYHKNIVEPSYGAQKRKEAGDGASLPERMPYIVIVVDELADMMTIYPRELESSIVRLAQMSRAVGIHLILSTQRPSVNVITGLIKANIPARVALQVASQIDSRTILDASGAEKLLGAGDMLYISGEMSKPIRVQSAFISEDEVKKVVKFLVREYSDAMSDEINFSETGNKNALFEASFDDEEEDELYEDAREVVMQAGKASSSYLQRRFKIGYARAARLIDMLEERGVVGPGEGAKPREVLSRAQSGDGQDDGSGKQKGSDI